MKQEILYHYWFVPTYTGRNNTITLNGEDKIFSVMSENRDDFPFLTDKVYLGSIPSSELKMFSWQNN